MCLFVASVYSVRFDSAVFPCTMETIGIGCVSKSTQRAHSQMLSAYVGLEPWTKKTTGWANRQYQKHRNIDTDAMWEDWVNSKRQSSTCYFLVHNDSPPIMTNRMHHITALVMSFLVGNDDIQEERCTKKYLEIWCIFFWNRNISCSIHRVCGC